MRLLVTGASGQLGGYLLRELSALSHQVTAWCHTRGGSLFNCPLVPVDLARPDGVAEAFRNTRPTAILHLAAFPAIADCHRDPEKAARINAAATAQLAELGATAKAHLAYTSTDLIFDGMRGNYGERDEAKPLSVYGRSKLAGEGAVLAAGGVAARLSLMFGPTLIGRPYFFDQQLHKMRSGQTVSWFEDEWRTPLGLAAAARALLAVVQSDFAGVLHIAGPERLSRFDMGRRLAAFHGIDPALVVPIPQASIATPEPRPRDVSLDCTLWRSLFPKTAWPTWEEALQEME